MKKLLDVEFYVAAAQQHGEDSEPDHEVGDLQDLLRVAWSLMTDKQRKAFSKEDRVRTVLDAAVPGWDED